MTSSVRSELDERYSRPGAAATEWPVVQQLLGGAPICWLTTVRADGRPHVTPLVAVWSDGRMYFCTGEDEQKAVNLRSNPCVVLTTGSNDWNRGTDVVVEGIAERVTDERSLAELAAIWATKWDGSWQFTPRDGAFAHAGDEHGLAIVFAVTIAKVLSFDKEGGAATRHVPSD